MKKFDDSLPETDPAQLDLPDWSGMDESTARISSDAAFQLCHQYFRWFPDLAKQSQSTRPEKCLVEFVL
jgi:hypothetical protein